MKNIILLDDQSMNSYILSMALNECYDLEIHICSCVNDALVILNRYKIDLILSDIMMPDIDGFEFVEYLEGNENFKDIPVFFISAINLNEKIEEKIKKTNAKGLIPKPFVIDEITKVLDEYLS